MRSGRRRVRNRSKRPWITAAFGIEDVGRGVEAPHVSGRAGVGFELAPQLEHQNGHLVSLFWSVGAEQLGCETSAGEWTTGRVEPVDGMRPIWGYVLALVIGTIVVAAVPWISIGFLK